MHWFLLVAAIFFERSYSGSYHELQQSPGTFHCASCDLPLFRTEEQIDVGNGWPNFSYPIAKENVFYMEDNQLGIQLYAVLCRQCKTPVGHVFNDGPPPKHLRFCVNSKNLRLVNKN